jgi:hypothetical protein
LITLENVKEEEKITNENYEIENEETIVTDSQNTLKEPSIEPTNEIISTRLLSPVPNTTFLSIESHLNLDETREDSISSPNVSSASSSRK